jgi:hypothetical protein
MLMPAISGRKLSRISKIVGFVEEGTVSEIYCKDGFEREHYQFFHPGVMFYKDKL